jgi:GTP-binding protein
MFTPYFAFCFLFYIKIFLFSTIMWYNVSVVHETKLTDKFFINRSGTSLKIREDIRNIAIIAHVDHGKTTLVDQLLRQSGIFRSNEHVEERAMDSNDLERERGITILAKNTAIQYKNTRINILDTPGHADFGGEVERIMKMVDGVLLVVDAYEGCMPQTRFVLKKALEQNLTPIVVVNKIDREFARPAEVIDEVIDLFIELDATEEQLEFPVIYASAINGTASLNPDKQDENMQVLYEAIIEHIPAPVDNSDEPLQFQVALLDYNEYVGRIGIGRVFRGTMHVGQQVALMKLDGSVKPFRVTKILGFFGLKRQEVQEAKAGDLVAVSGMEDINVGETVCPFEHQEALPILRIDEPTLQMTFAVNNSPFAGREGKFVTARKIEERLQEQLHTDVSLRVENTDSPDAWIVSGRGELHLSILIENMRREGFELQVSKPEVIVKEIDGVRCEPVERVQIDVPEEHTGAVMESIGARKGELLDMVNNGNGQVRLIFNVPARGLIGYTTEFLTLTRGYGIINHTFDSYQPMLSGQVGGRRNGVLVSMETGKASTYGIMQVEDRGTIFVEPGTEIYEGMIVGENTRENDISVNITKVKHATNVRSATKDQTAVIKKPRIMTLEESLEYLNDDEYCEVTPKSIRLRKKILDKSEREKLARKKKYAEMS